ncbi:MAG: hypothetical protein ABEJ42_10155 [Halobacteriaceae archaeon]
MVETLTVHVNRDGIHSVTAPAAVESDGPVVVELHNHGEPSHVHLRLTGPLASVASLGATNHYVDTQERSVPLEVEDVDAYPVTGEIEIVTGYGQETATVEVTLTEPEPAEPEPAVTVESGTEPDGAGGDGPGTGALSGGGSLVSGRRWRGILPVAVLALVAVGLAAVAVQVAGDSIVVAAGVGVVAVAILVAGYLLSRG